MWATYSVCCRRSARALTSSRGVLASWAFSLACASLALAWASAVVALAACQALTVVPEERQRAMAAAVKRAGLAYGQIFEIGTWELGGQRGHRFVGKVTLNIGGKGGGRFVAAGAVFFEGFHSQSIELERQGTGD